LGLISRCITYPLWCVLEDKSVTITDMNARYLEMVTYMEDALNNLDKFMSGELLLFEQYVQRDCISRYLVEPGEFDETVQ